MFETGVDALSVSLNAKGIVARYSGPGPIALISLVLVFAVVAGGGLIGLSYASKQMAFAMVAILLVVITLVLSGNPRLFALYGLLLSVPLNMRKAFLVTFPHMGGASALTFDGCDVFLVILLLFILRDVAAHRLTLRFAPNLAICWGGLIALGLVDTVVGPMRLLAFLEAARMLKCYLLFFVIINEVVRARQFMHAILAIALGIALEDVITLIQYTFKVNLGLQFLGESSPAQIAASTKGVYLDTVDIYRAGGLFGHANMLAGFLAIQLPMCIALIFSRTGPLAKAGLAGTVVAGLAALVITQSRSGWLAFATGFMLLLISSMLHQKLRLRYVLARILVILGIIVALSLASDEIIRRFTASDPGAVKYRWDWMYAAFDMIKAHPIFGVGLNSWVAHFPEYANPPGRAEVNATYGDVWPVVHNSYLIVWSQQGTVGLCFLIGLYAVVLWTGARTARYLLDDRLYAINLGATCGIVAIMVDGVFSFFLNEPASLRVFFVVVALIYAAHYWTQANRPQYARAHARPRVPPGNLMPVGQTGHSLPGS